jgi:hypothetical protein
MKILRVVRYMAIVALALVYFLTSNRRAGLTDSSLAAYQPQIKRAEVSVSVEREGRIIKIEGIQAPGQVGKPCSATLVFEPNSR